jgi:hypothetical protein
MIYERWTRHECDTDRLEERLMNRYEGCTLATARLIAVLAALVLGAPSADAQVGPTPCDLRLRVELCPDVPNPLGATFLASLAGEHAGYRLTLEWQEPASASLFTLDLTGPGPEAACRDVVDSMRKDARVVSIEVLRDAATTAQPVRTAQPLASTHTESTPLGTVRAGPDGDWVLEPLNVPYPQQARDRYECDIWAAGQTGFDPTKDYGGLPPNGVTAKRADYLRAQAACFEARGYLVR